VEERLSRLEAIVQYHEKMLSELRDHIGRINDELGVLKVKVEAELATLKTEIKNMKEEFDRSTSRKMWLVGIMISIISIVANIILRFVHP